MMNKRPQLAPFTRVSIMRDLYADWKRWTRFERISALGGLCVLIILVPVLTMAAALTH